MTQFQAAHSIAVVLLLGGYAVWLKSVWVSVSASQKACEDLNCRIGRLEESRSDSSRRIGILEKKIDLLAQTMAELTVEVREARNDIVRLRGHEE